MNKKIFLTALLALIHAVLWFVIVIPIVIKENTIWKSIIIIILAVAVSILTSKIPHFHPKTKIVRITIVIVVLILVITYYMNFDTIVNLIK